MIKYIITLSTLVIGMVYSRNNIRNLFSNLVEIDYMNWNEFNTMLEKQRRLAKV